jgi:hypothetical protein
MRAESVIATIMVNYLIPFNLINMDQHLIRSQIISMSLLVPGALNYHYKNLLKTQPKIKAWLKPKKDGEKIDPLEFEEAVESLQTAKYEAMAYLNQTGRLKKFFESMEKLGYTSTKDVAFLENAFFLRNKWTAHRSVDWPFEDDDDRFHWQVVANLDTSSQFNMQGELVLELFHEKEGRKIINIVQDHSGFLEKLMHLFKSIRIQAGIEPNPPTSYEQT